MNNLIFLREELYSLKREYGTSLALYRVAPADPSYTTGVRNDTKTKYEIEYAIVVPVKFDTATFYTTAFLKASRQFALGGYQDQEVKRIIIDGEDLPNNFEILPQDYIVFNGAKYEVYYVEKLEPGVGYQLIAKRLVGAPVNDVHYVSVTDDIRFLDLAGGAL